MPIDPFVVDPKVEMLINLYQEEDVTPELFSPMTDNQLQSLDG